MGRSLGIGGVHSVPAWCKQSLIRGSTRCQDFTPTGTFRLKRAEPAVLVPTVELEHPELLFSGRYCSAQIC